MQNYERVDAEEKRTNSEGMLVRFYKSPLFSKEKKKVNSGKKRIEKREGPCNIG